MRYARNKPTDTKGVEEEIALMARRRPWAREWETARTMLDANLRKGWLPRKVRFRCVQCAQMCDGIRWADSKRRTADTWGYVEFAREAKCCECLGESYVGEIINPHTISDVKPLDSPLGSC